ncbi:hypothetical protein pb186bvf_007199 [Paramecium bursaria]
MNKQKKKQQNENLQKVPKKAFQQPIFKNLYYPNTQTNRKLFQILNMDFKEKSNLYIQLKLDVSQWINLHMMIQIRNYEISTQQNVKNDRRLIFFSRTLIREIMKHLIILIQQLEKDNLFLISLDIQEVWINFKINQNLIEFQKIVILNEFSQDQIHLAEHRKRIGITNYQLDSIILELTSQYQIKDDFINNLTSYTQLIDYIDKQLKDKQAEFMQDYNRPYNQTNIEQIRNQNVIQKNKDIILSIQDNFYFELHLYQISNSKKNQMQGKLMVLKQQVESYIQQYDIIFNETKKSQQLKDLIIMQLLEGIKSQKYINYLENFIRLEFNLDACIQRSWIQTQIQQLIFEEESPIRKYTLQKIMIELYYKEQNMRFDKFQNYIDDLKLQISRKLEVLVTQIAHHLNLNIKLKVKLKQSKMFNFIYDAVSQILIGKLGGEFHEDEQIQLSLIQLLPDIKSTIQEFLSEYIQGL